MIMKSHTLNQVTHVSRMIMCDSYDHLWLVLSCVTWFNVCDYIIMSHMYYHMIILHVTPDNTCET
jgi:hypothetical protein